MSLNPTEVSASGRVAADPSIPQWKRELILRRRVFGRTLGNSSVKLTCPAVVALVRQPDSISSSNLNQYVQINEDTSTASRSLNQDRVDFHPSTSSSVVSVGVDDTNMRLLDKCSGDGNKLPNGIDMTNKQSAVIASDICIMGEDKSVKNRSAFSSLALDKKSPDKINFKIKRYASNEPVNGKPSIKDDGNLSDSSEELQYGPGIVNKLKSKYLSMTLREHKRATRPSIINLRRATSLENMLDEVGENESAFRQSNCNLGVNALNNTEQKYSNKRASYNGKKVIIGLNSRTLAKHLGNRSLETLKRARSMDTLLKSDSTNISEQISSDRISTLNNSVLANSHNPLSSIVNENLIIVENKQISSSGESVTDSPVVSPVTNRNTDVTVSGEFPPPDLVKQTLRIFETSPKKTIKSQHQNSLARNTSGISKSSSHNQPKISNKPILSPKPTYSVKGNRVRVTSSKKNRPIENFGSTNYVQPKLYRNETDKYTHYGQTNFLNASLKSDKGSIGDSTSKVIGSPSISPIVTVLPNNEKRYSPPVQKLESSSDGFSRFSQPKVEDSKSPVAALACEDIDSRDSKLILESALENIRRGGVTLQFSFTNENSQNSALSKSYLPRSKSPAEALNSTIMKENIEEMPLKQTTPVANIAVPRQNILQHTKQIGVIRPLMTRTQSSTALTEQEIEKNQINRVKSIEQPVSKVVVAIKSLPENVVLGSVSSDIVTNKNLTLTHVCANSKNNSQRLWDDKLWQQNQNTIVFNFSDRKEVPDYIENDGLILRGKKDRPRVGEGGVILLDAGAEESSTDAEDPISPCDVTFEGGNVLINGRSNLKKEPRQTKLRITFNDEATTMFEYPSEASLTEEDASEDAEAASASGIDEPDDNKDTATPNSPTNPPRSHPLGGSLGAYTPRQMATEEWQFGVTPVQTLPPPPPVEPSPTVDEDHFKPASPESTVAWSEGAASDLLF